MKATYRSAISSVAKLSMAANGLVWSVLIHPITARNIHNGNKVDYENSHWVDFDIVQRNCQLLAMRSRNSDLPTPNRSSDKKDIDP